jgi:predicted N-formylglutamate amidohydrolase
MSMALTKERIQTNDAPTSLLAADEPQPVTVTNEGGRSPFFIVADHAWKYLPRRLQVLGLQEAECERHIAWDIGAGAVCCLIGDALGAVVIRQNYSRLAIDCNRTPGSETSIVELSERTTVPGNIGLGKAQIEVRVREIFQPYHDRIAGELDRRRQACRTDGADRCAQLYARIRGRCAALAYQRALQP